MRTELYSCPFRVLQFDAVACRDEVGRMGGAIYVLTAMCCCFFPMVLAYSDYAARRADNRQGIGGASVLGSCALPAVARSDNAKEFIGGVMQQVNALLDIRHVTGSAYHPQSQGNGRVNA